jgi:Rv2525c-like, glycoside hydrolase-like domain
VDYAWSRPDPAGLYAAGKRFASRYLSYDTTGKNLTAAEADELVAAGLAVVCNWEWQAGDARNGYDAGRKYAQEAAKQAAACGMPAGRPIYFSVDYDPAGYYGQIDAYFRGIASVLPVEQIGAYGGYDTIDYLLAGGLIRWAWQTYAWSGGRWHPGAHVQQYRNGVIVAGGDVDLNRATVDDFGQWPARGDDMALTDDEHRMLANLDRQATSWFYDLAEVSGINNGTEPPRPHYNRERLIQLEAKVDQILQLLSTGVQVPTKVDLTDAAVAAIRSDTRGAVADGLEGGLDAVRGG